MTVRRSAAAPCQTAVDTAALVGVDDDLVIKPLQWKGSVASIREFNRDAAHNELGLQAVELVGDDVDGDGDGVVNELTVGDQTALAIYLAAQPRPVTRLELDRLGLIPALSADERRQIDDGRRLFRATGCASCHTPELRIDDPVFAEPSRSGYYRDARVPRRAVADRQRRRPRVRGPL